MLNLSFQNRAARMGLRRICKYAVIAVAALAFNSEVGINAFAQRTTSTNSRGGFRVYGDVKVDETEGAAPKPAVLDVILYTKGNQLVGRQRISPNGRYRFMDLFDGDYYIVVEMENTEVARVSLFISPTSPTELKQDIALEWRATSPRTGAGLVSAADSYSRTSSNASLYQKSTRELDAKDYSRAAETLKQLVASDPNDFPAWADLGMIYFVVQKDYEAAENAYLGALKANEKYFSAMLNLGRVRIAKKNYEGAIESLEASVKLDPKSASANYFLGEAYLQIKKGSKAVVYLNQAITLDPMGMADAHLRLAALYNGAGMKDKAATEYEQFLKKKPDYSDKAKLEKYIADNKKQQ